ncbi:MAG: hypothetical protein KatS3mg082_2940 [Nitrospiraceae bacterium]|nr:MAG: hypothetical protein KatS3mg081_2465 [Gemmatimonadales bacterium]GIW56536.1 MAG: hypothetical protein KatS3mg082_2940 [Nitrospiraceae bacterium]
MSGGFSDIEEWVSEWSQIWPTCCALGRWLYDVFRPPWPHDIRRARDDQRRMIWAVPDYDRGRSRTLGVERDVLRDCQPDVIIGMLEGAGWRGRIEDEDLLVRKTSGGALEVVAWNAPRLTKWFWSPEHQEWFVAFQSHAGGISWGGPPPPIRYFVAINGKRRATVGPEGKHEIESLEFDRIKNYLPIVRKSHETRFSR